MLTFCRVTRLRRLSTRVHQRGAGHELQYFSSCLHHFSPFLLSSQLPELPSPQFLAASSSLSPPLSLTSTSTIISKISQLISFLTSLLKSFSRATHITISLSPLLILAPFSHPATPSSFFNNYTSAVLTHLGPAFIKLGQWMATRRDLFPSSFCDTLSSLHSNNSTHPIQYTNQVLDSLFTSSNPPKIITPDIPLGVGCVASVYEAIYNDQPVAIKCVHPRIKDTIEEDVKLMRLIAVSLESIPLIKGLKYFCFSDIVDEFGEIMVGQLDMRKEHKALETFRTHNKNAEIDFPTPIFSAEDVLIMSYEEGVSISEFIATGNKDWNKKLAGLVLNTFLKMVFVDNFIHCDLHPGNVLVKDDGKVVFIDAGIVTELSATDAKNLKDLFRCVVLNDGKKAGRLMIERAKFEVCSKKEGGVEEFSKKVESIVEEFHDGRKRGGLTLGAVKIGELMGRMLELCRTHGVSLEPAMCNVILSTLVLEGLGRSLDDEMDLMRAALRFIMMSK